LRYREANKVWRKSGEDEPPVHPERSGMALWAALISFVGIRVTMLDGMVYYAEPGYNDLVQYPTGTRIGETTPGFHFNWWGSAVAFKKLITVKASGQRDSSVTVPTSSISRRSVRRGSPSSPMPIRTG